MGVKIYLPQPMAHIVQSSLFDSKTFSFQLTSVLLVTCYVAVLSLELWLQWPSDYFDVGYSGVQLDTNTLEVQPCFCCYGNDKPSPEESVRLVWTSFN